MTTTAPDRRRRLRAMQLIFAGAATLAMIALFDAARPDATPTALGAGSVRATDVALAAPASGPFGGFAADNDDDQAQQQEQQALQQMQQSEQQAEQQNEQAQLQAQQAEQQGQWVEDHPGP
ncbi:hypothetical protein [Mycobacterium sp.]|jgi:hypothetical protein|uniref:hypothetical protein n=1 Tax=Mycobacterium sp. TaxID=1785 RepID=UPI0026101D49|nr:hypothetical protein [Mycobacterium sp.]